MPITRPGPYTPASSALTLLRQAGTDAGLFSSSRGALSIDKPAVVYGGSLSQDGLNPHDAIRKILSQSRSPNVPDVASKTGATRLRDAIERLGSAGIELNVKVDEKTFHGAAATALGDENIAHIAKYAQEIATSDEDAYRMLKEHSRKAAFSAHSNKFDEVIHEAFVTGQVDLIPVSEYGIKGEETSVFHYSATGQFLGAGGSRDTTGGETTVDELYANRLIHQEDGTRIDVQTGLYSSYVSIGGRDYIGTFGKAPA